MALFLICLVTIIGAIIYMPKQLADAYTNEINTNTLTSWSHLFSSAQNLFCAWESKNNNKKRAEDDLSNLIHVVFRKK